MTTTAAAAPVDRVSIEAALQDKLAALTLEQKVTLMTGADFWSTVAVPEIGLQKMVLSDGPAGVRGAAWDERDPSLNLPSGTALAATWDTRMAEQYGEVLAGEARRKGVQVVLGPTINMQRSPRGGRHFEAFSEDPVLAGELAVAYTRGLQGQGIAAVPKHYVGNDSEDERFHVDVQIDERTLREVYLSPFEAVVRRGEAWGVMSAYNRVNGITMSESPLLNDPLASEWGFDGLVISDWTAVRSTVAAARSRQDLAMPGPSGPWGASLIEAVIDGRVAESDVDEKVRRLLRLAWRVGALTDVPPPGRARAATRDPIVFARKASAASMVLLENRGGVLPLDSALKSVAVIGEAAMTPRTQGGGSAFVIPEHIVSPLDGLREALPAAAVSYSPGVAVARGLIPFALHDLTNPITGEAGVHVRFLDAPGDEILAQERRSAHLVWTGGVPDGAAALEVTARYRPRSSRTVELAVETIGTIEVFVDRVLLISGRLASRDDVMGTGLLAPPRLSEEITVTAGEPMMIRVVNDLASRGHLSNAASISFGLVASDEHDQERIDEAARAAADAEVAIVVVGTTSQDESEGSDRTTLNLPGRQDDLVAAVAAANPRTIVIVNAGSPVVMPWRGRVSAIILTWFPGQEYGYALADVLTGVLEPGGRLPTSWPEHENDVPVLSTTPDAGVLRYQEGVHIGYRAWLKAGTEPAYAFGHGLGYTTFDAESVRISHNSPSAAAEINFLLRNTGVRLGKYVAQAYLSGPHSIADQPVRWLAAFESVELEAGGTRAVRIEIPVRAFQHWENGWAIEPGAFKVYLGASVKDLVHIGDVTMG